MSNANSYNQSIDTNINDLVDILKKFRQWQGIDDISIEEKEKLMQSDGDKLYQAYCKMDDDETGFKWSLDNPYVKYPLGIACCAMSTALGATSIIGCGKSTLYGTAYRLRNVCGYDGCLSDIPSTTLTGESLGCCVLSYLTTGPAIVTGYAAYRCLKYQPKDIFSDRDERLKSEDLQRGQNVLQREQDVKEFKQNFLYKIACIARQSTKYKDNDRRKIKDFFEKIYKIKQYKLPNNGVVSENIYSGIGADLC